MQTPWRIALSYLVLTLSLFSGCSGEDIGEQLNELDDASKSTAALTGAYQSSGAALQVNPGNCVYRRNLPPPQALPAGSVITSMNISYSGSVPAFICQGPNGTSNACPGTADTNCYSIAGPQLNSSVLAGSSATGVYMAFVGTASQLITGISVIVNYQYTPPSVPPSGATTAAATAITPTTFTLNGSAIPNTPSAVGYFRISDAPGTCNESFGLRFPETPDTGVGLGTGSSPVNFSWSIQGATPNFTYYYCAIAKNTAGTSFGTVQSFTTPPAAPTITMLPPTNPVVGGSTWRASVYNANQAVTIKFRHINYSVSPPPSCASLFFAVPSSGISMAASNAVQQTQHVISGLYPGGPNMVCAQMTLPSGAIIYSPVVSFRAPNIPTTKTYDAVDAVAPGAVQSSGVKLNGWATTWGVPGSTGWFRYSTTSPGSCNTTFGQSTTPVPLNAPNEWGSGSFETNVTLSPGTYYVCALSNNGVATVAGELKEFYVPPAGYPGRPVLTYQVGDYCIGGIFFRAFASANTTSLTMTVNGVPVTPEQYQVHWTYDWPWTPPMGTPMTLAVTATNAVGSTSASLTFTMPCQYTGAGDGDDNGGGDDDGGGDDGGGD